MAVRLLHRTSGTFRLVPKGGDELKRLAFLIMAFAGLLSAADLTGKWIGSFTMTSVDGQTRTQPCVLILKQDGGTLTGTAGNEQHQLPISNGKVTEGRVTFDAANSPATVSFDLKLDSDRLRGEATVEHAERTAVAKVDLKRADK